MNNRKGRGIGIYVIVLVVLLGTIAALSGGIPSGESLTYYDVIQLFEKGEVKEFVLSGYTLRLTLQDGTKVQTEVPSQAMFNEDLGDTIKRQLAQGILVSGDMQQPQISWLSQLAPYLIIIGIFGAFWFFMFNRQDGGAKSTMNFGKSRAKLAGDDSRKVTFADVAGADEEKADLEEVVEFLREPRKYMMLGARIPKGVLLVGPPGTGKTLIAKAVAGEAGVPFFSISGSDFVELYVGVGASRVRDLFAEAKKHAPSIVFIDEIDAVGRRRGAGLGGGHDEREQTLNQLLVEMDGFGNNAGVIIIAATNRVDILDPALMRPGRFDRQIYIGAPDKKGRKEILRVHARKKPFEPEVDFDEIARSSVGFTGADLENLLNEAALLTARRNKTKIGNKEIDAAFWKVVMGNEKKSRVITEKERKITAYHEAGHAIAAELLETADPVQQVSIIPRGRAGGFTYNPPVEDKYHASKREMEEEMVVLLGGRAAEMLVFGEVYTGASNDIEKVSELARRMVTRYGMSEKVGTLAFSDHDEVFLGRDFTSSKAYSEATAALIDQEIKALADVALARCNQLMKDNAELLHRVADALLEHETLDGAEFKKIIAGEALDRPQTPPVTGDPDAPLPTLTAEEEDRINETLRRFAPKPEEDNT